MVCVARQLDHRIVDDEQGDRAEHGRGAAQVALRAGVGRSFHRPWIARPLGAW
jgi:hypothetical protein